MRLHCVGLVLFGRLQIGFFGFVRFAAVVTFVSFPPQSV